METYNLKKIYDEFIEISQILSNFNYDLIEDLNLIQFELQLPIENNALLLKLSNLKYFESLLSNKSHALDYYIDNTSGEIKSKFYDELLDTKLRIKYFKEDLTDKCREINLHGIFFNVKPLFEYISSSKLHTGTTKLNIALYNTLCFSTQTINFYSLDALPNSKYELEDIDDSIITSLNLLNQFTKINGGYDINNIFTFTPNEEITEVTDFSKEMVSNYYKQFLSIFSYKISDDCSEFNIRGKKSILIKYDDLYDIEYFEYYGNILNLLLSGDKFLEKYIIIKDVITRYLNNNSSITNLNSKICDIDKTIKHYYNKYINDDIDEFFNNRDSIYKEAIAMSKSINEQNDKIIAYINSTLISIIVLAVTFVFKNSTKLDSNFILTTFSILSVFSIYFYRTIKDNSVTRTKSIEDQFDLFISSIGIIPSKEQNEIKEKFIKSPKTDLNRALLKIKYLLFTINAILFILLIFSFFEPIIVSPTSK